MRYLLNICLFSAFLTACGGSGGGGSSSSSGGNGGSGSGGGSLLLIAGDSNGWKVPCYNNGGYYEIDKIVLNGAGTTLTSTGSWYSDSSCTTHILDYQGVYTVTSTGTCSNNSSGTNFVAIGSAYYGTAYTVAGQLQIQGCSGSIPTMNQTTTLTSYSSCYANEHVLNFTGYYGGFSVNGSAPGSSLYLGKSNGSYTCLSSSLNCCNSLTAGPLTAQ